MTLDKLVPTPEEQGQLRSALRHAFCSILLNNLEGFTAGGSHTVELTKQVAARKPTIQQLAGAGEKTNFYPLPALDEEEASVKGTIQVVQVLIRNTLKLTAEAASSTLQLFIGDWMSI